MHCVCMCACVHLLHTYAWTLISLYVSFFFFCFFLIKYIFIADNISISMYIMCVILCMFSTLSRRVGALQISIIIFIIIKSLANFWACDWWICLQQCTHQVLWTLSHSHRTLWKPWHPLASHHEHHRHISYHWHCTTWSEDCHHQTSVEKAITW